MRRYRGIYNFHITKAIKNDFFEILPLCDNEELKTILKEKDSYNLTATVIFSNEDRDGQCVSDLESVLSFIEQKDVLLTNHTEVYSHEQASMVFHKKLYGKSANQTEASFFLKDIFSQNSRSVFIEKAFCRLKQNQTGVDRAYRQAIFKVSEIFKMTRPFFDINYYLLFSALEALAREKINNYDCSAAESIAKYLQNLQFDIKQQNDNDLKRSALAYTNLRNGLFHNGRMGVSYKSNEKTIELELKDYYIHLYYLVQLAIIKETGFDDGYINWDAWINLQ